MRKKILSIIMMLVVNVAIGYANILLTAPSRISTQEGRSTSLLESINSNNIIFILIWIAVVIYLLYRFIQSIVYYIDRCASKLESHIKSQNESRKRFISDSYRAYLVKYPLTCFKIYQNRGRKFALTLDDLEYVMESSLSKEAKRKDLKIYEKNDSEVFIKQKIREWETEIWRKKEREYKTMFYKRINFVRSTYGRVFRAIENYPFLAFSQVEIDHKYILLAQLSTTELKQLDSIFDRIELLEKYKATYPHAYDRFKYNGVLKDGCVRSAYYSVWINETQWKQIEDEIEDEIQKEILNRKLEHDLTIFNLKRDAKELWYHCKKMVEDFELKYPGKLGGIQNKPLVMALKERDWEWYYNNLYEKTGDLVAAGEECKNRLSRLKIALERLKIALESLIKEEKIKFLRKSYPNAYYVLKNQGIDLLSLPKQSWEKEEADPINKAKYLQRNYRKGFIRFFNTPNPWTIEIANNIVMYADVIKMTHNDIVQKEKRIVQAKEIRDSYPLGFKHFYPSVQNWTPDFANEVLKKKHAISSYHSQLLTAQKRLEDAKSLEREYPDGFNYFFTNRNWSSDEFIESVLKKQKDIISRNQAILNERKEKERRRQAEWELSQRISKLKQRVASWHVTRYGIAHDYIYEYLKTTSFRQATEVEWNIRNLIWAFKNDPDKPSRKYSYQEALNQIVIEYERKLKCSFDGCLSELTLVCVPASSSEKNTRRWRTFCYRICDDLGMQNGYEHIEVTSAATPKHLGGTGHPDLYVDAHFFNGKYIVLCDDIKTSGKSLQRMKELLESRGAKVICALTIGQTISE